VAPIIRAANAEDRDPVLAIALRLSQFGPPPWRTAAEVNEGELRTLQQFFAGRAPSTSSLLVAELAGGVAGFTYLEQFQDYFTLEAHGHIGIIAVSEQVEGQGVGAALMGAADAWARGQGYRKLTLSVFQDNTRERAVYEHFGFRSDTIRYLKPLDRAER
jgi:GNAT superfamily N-acetyltransferase